MIAFIHAAGGTPEELPSGTKIILDLGPWKTIELHVDDQDYKGDTVVFKMVTKGKPYAKIVNSTNLVVGISNVPADPEHKSGPPPATGG